MKRRTFLVGSAGLAGSRAIDATPVQARAASRPLGRWTWSTRWGRYQVIARRNGMVLSTTPDHEAPAADPLVTVGPEQRPVIWETASWQEPDDDRRRLLLTERDGKLLATIDFALDPGTGLLSQRAVLSHRGEGESDIRATRASSPG